MPECTQNTHQALRRLAWAGDALSVRDCHLTEARFAARFELTGYRRSRRNDADVLAALGAQGIVDHALDGEFWFEAQIGPGAA